MHDFSQKPAVFLDRDDTLIRCNGLAPGNDLGDPALVEPLPGAVEACRLLKNAGFVLVVITNQGGVARGRYTMADVERVHERINAVFQGVFDAFRACPYHPEGTVPKYAREHPWRKPSPGMILDAAQELNIDLARSWVIGDKERDAAAGRTAGCTTILISVSDDDSGGKTPETSGVQAPQKTPKTGAKSPETAPLSVDFFAPDLRAAAAIILSHANPPLNK